MRLSGPATKPKRSGSAQLPESANEQAPVRVVMSPRFHRAERALKNDFQSS
jgi:hypothetical protein